MLAARFTRNKKYGRSTRGNNVRESSTAPKAQVPPVNGGKGKNSSSSRSNSNNRNNSDDVGDNGDDGLPAASAVPSSLNVAPSLQTDPPHARREAEHPAQ